MKANERKMLEFINAVEHVQKSTWMTMKDLMLSIYNAWSFLKHAEEKQKENPMLFELYINKINDAENEKQCWIRKLFNYLK